MIPETALAKQRLRAELGLGARLSGVGDSAVARIDDRAGETLRRAAARRAATDGDRVAEARERADPNGVLSDADVRDVLAREGVGA